MDQSSISQLFVRIVERLVLEKPAVPFLFVVEFLLKSFPSDGQIAVHNINPHKSARLPAIQAE